MMLGRFQSYAWIRMKDGRCFWGWFEETRVATAWFLSYSDTQPDPEAIAYRESYFRTEDIQEIHPCEPDMCESLTDQFGFGPVDYDQFFDELLNTLGDRLERALEGGGA